MTGNICPYLPQAPTDPVPTAPPLKTRVTLLSPGIHHRVIASLDPDQMNNQEGTNQ